MLRKIWDVFRACALASLICVCMIIFYVLGPILLVLLMLFGGMLAIAAVLYMAFAQARADKLKQEDANHKDL